MDNNIKLLTGNWDAGYVLDKHTLHSEYIGDNEFGHPQFSTTRSEVGEAIYQLKYRSKFENAAPLAQEIVNNIVPKFEKIGVVIPMPPSKVRQKQPVTEISRHVAAALGVGLFENILLKNPAPAGSPELKNLAGKEAKVEALKARFALNDGITNDGKWNVLLVDDLYDTGASMEAACAVLRTYSKVAKIYVAALTWK